MKRFLLAFSTLALSASLLSAADVRQRNRGVEQPPAQAVYNWTGLYIGLNGGGGIGTSGASSSATSVLVPNDPADRMKGWMFGGQLGARQQVGVWVFGLKADIDWANITNRATSSNTVRRTFFATQLADTTSSQTNGAKVHWLSTVTADAGIVLWEKALWSLRGGFAFGKVSWDNSQNVTTTPLTPAGVAACGAGAISCPNGSAAATDSKVKTGYTLGTAFEVALNRNLSTAIMYDYVALGSVGGALGSQRVDLHLFRGAFNYRF